MSLKDILQIERDRVTRDLVVLTTVYDRMKNRIISSVEARSKDCIYKIPEFIPGYPLINVTKTMTYLLDKLKAEGFIVVPLSRTELYITWDPDKIMELNKKVEWIVNDSKDTSIKGVKDLKVVNKEIERVNEDFLSSLINTKKSRT